MKEFEINQIYNEDCIHGMKRMPSEIVDLIITDPLVRRKI